MKLQNELKNVIEKMSKIEKSTLEKHIEMVKQSKEFNNLETRIAWDMGYAAIGTKTMCEWHGKYNCNDTHIGTLFKKSMNIVLKEKGIVL